MQRQRVTSLTPAPLPDEDTILQIRCGKIGRLGSEKSAIFKKPQDGLVEISSTGPVEDEHFYPAHGGTHRAVHQYSSVNYPKWRHERPDKRHLFQQGAFGENLVSASLTEENVCIGDVFQVGDEKTGVILEVSEPRNACYKLNIRLEWNRALQRIVRTGRVGWNFRVLQPGHIQKGDSMILLDRRYPNWSILNAHKVLFSTSVEPALLEELYELEPLSTHCRMLATTKLQTVSRKYKLVDIKSITARVMQLTVELQHSTKLKDTKFAPHAYAQIKFGPNLNLSRSYSIVSGDMKRFVLGISLADNSRGGSAYIHKNMKIGDEIEMAPGSDPAAAEADEKCSRLGVENRMVIIGGIGVTAFLPLIQTWRELGLPYTVHYAVRSMEDAAYLDMLSPGMTTVYAKSRGERLDVSEIIPKINPEFMARIRIFCCGPDSLMNACRRRLEEIKYPPYMVHFESFGAAPTGHLGDPFEVTVNDAETNRISHLSVPSDKSLLRVLNEAGFDVPSSCQSGKCGTCKLAVTSGEVWYNSDRIMPSKPGEALLSCVDRGVGKIDIEVD